MRAAPRWLSDSFLRRAFLKSVPHGLSDDFRQALHQALEVSREAVHFLLQRIESAVDAVEPSINAVEPRPDRGKVVTVAARLLENVARDHFLALDLLLEHADPRHE